MQLSRLDTDPRRGGHAQQPITIQSAPAFEQSRAAGGPLAGRPTGRGRHWFWGACQLSRPGIAGASQRVFATRGVFS